MPTIPHTEKHFRSSEVVRDVVIGMSDGLTVPFALAAGLTGIGSQVSTIVTAGMAEIVAGAIAMGLGGYLAARSDQEHYHSELEREFRETEEVPEKEAEEVSEVFRQYGLPDNQIVSIVTALRQNQKNWVDFMMRFELGLEKPNPGRILTSTLTIAGSYIIGGMIPLTPYMIVSTMQSALVTSVVATITALAIFGYVKAMFTGLKPWRGALQTTLIGGVAASAAFGIARLIG